MTKDKIGLSLPIALEASVCINNEDQVYFIGGRENSGDTNKILTANLLKPADLSEVTNAGQLTKKRCLHKGLAMGDNLVIVGGTEFDSIQILNRYTMGTVNDAEFTNQLRTGLESVTFNSFFLKKCSNA